MNSGSSQWPDERMDQGALNDRCLHVLEVLSGLLGQFPPGAPVQEISWWLQKLMRVLTELPSQALGRFLAEALTVPADAGSDR